MAHLQLQRSTISFRRQGSSGLVWDDRFATEKKSHPKDSFLSGELGKSNKLQQRSSSPPFIRSFSLNKDFRHINTTKPNNVKINSNTTACSDCLDIPNDPPSPRRKGWVCCGGFGKGSRPSDSIQPIKSRPR
ncbi:hypothetical protein RND81_09G123100 [Saponaria officinalis]|uniref:Uncharacterized protein n=1 Tax=Saponaria officinalis TaxID=3572 RepID=A0AAW1ILY3_SAPOF